MSELLPCPFCGKVGTLQKEWSSWGHLPPTVQVVCFNCGSRGPKKENKDGTDKSEHDAIAQWNMRVDRSGVRVSSNQDTKSQLLEIGFLIDSDSGNPVLYNHPWEIEVLDINHDGLEVRLLICGVEESYTARVLPEVKTVMQVKRLVEALQGKPSTAELLLAEIAEEKLVNALCSRNTERIRAERAEKVFAIYNDTFASMRLIEKDLEQLKQAILKTICQKPLRERWTLCKNLTAHATTAKVAIVRIAQCDAMKVKIGPYHYKIVEIFNPTLGRQVVSGCIDYETLEIIIEKRLTGAVKLQILMHEIVHALDSQYKLNLSEDQVDRISTGITEVLIRNGWLFGSIFRASNSKK